MKKLSTIALIAFSLMSIAASVSARECRDYHERGRWVTYEAYEQPRYESRYYYPEYYRHHRHYYHDQALRWNIGIGFHG